MLSVPSTLLAEKARVSGISRRCSRPASKADVQLFPLNSKTQWIWIDSATPNQYVWLRRTFTLQSRPVEATLRITANDHYRVWINGHAVGQGAVPHREPWIPLDSYDLLPHLKSGVNCLAILGHFLGTPSHTHSSVVPGVLAEIHLRFSDGVAECISTDDQWRAHQATPWICRPSRRRSWATGFAEDFNAIDDIADWNAVDFDDDDWTLASASSPRLHKFFLRTTPVLQETFLPVRNLIGAWVGGAARSAPQGISPTVWLDTEPLVPASATLFEAIHAAVESGQPFTIPPDLTQSLALTFDLGCEWSGHIEFTMDAPEGCRIEGVGAERLKHGRAQAGLKGADYAFRYITRSGRQQWREHHYNGLRYLHLVFRPRSGAIRVQRLGLLRREAALAITSRFDSASQEWNRLDQVSRHTLQICTQDVQVDCPTREQAPYIGDGIWTGLWTAWLTGDPAYLRQLLFFARTGQLSNGLMTGAPLSGLGPSNVLFDYCLLYTWGLWQLYFYTGDKQDIRVGLAASERMLGWFFKQLNPDGLLRLDAVESQKNGQGILFLDHNGLGWHIPDEPGIDRSGANAGLHFLFVQTLDYHLRLCRAAGLPCHLPYDFSTVRRLRKFYRSYFWNPVEQLFADGRQGPHLSTSFSEQTQALAVLAQIVPPSRAPALLARILALSDRPVARCTTYFMIYLAQAMLQTGLRQELFRLIVQRWQPMVDAGATTWWETFSGDELDSYCHPWSSLPLWLSLRLVLGIEPRSPGWRKVAITPLRELIPSGRGSVITPHGAIRVEWSPNQPVHLHKPDGIVAL